MGSAMSSGVASLRDRVARDASEPFLRSAYSLMVNVLATSVLGFAFWIAAARMFPSSTVGRDSALVAAMVTISVVCQLNLSSGVLRFLPIVKVDTAKAVLGAYAATTVVSAIGATLFVLVAPRLSASYGFLATDTPLAVFYVLAVTAWGIFALQDAVLTALRRAPWVPLENTVFGVLKITALPLLLLAGATHAVFVAWIVPMVLLLIPVNYLIFSRVIPAWPGGGEERSPVESFGWRGLVSFLTQDYFAMIFTQAASTLLPVVVVALVGSSQGAYFYMPFTIVSAFDLVFLNIAYSLTVEGALASSRYPVLLRLAVKRFRHVQVAGVLILIAGASVILLPFGPGYVMAGTPVLRLLACASMFRMVVALFGVTCRVEGRASRILAMQTGIFVMVIGLTIALGGTDGIVGAALAWLIAHVIAGSAGAPRVLRVLKEGRALVNAELRLATS